MGYVGTRLQVDCDRLHRAGAVHLRRVANHYADCTAKLAAAANAQLGLPDSVQEVWRLYLGAVHEILSTAGQNIGAAGDGLVIAAQDYSGQDYDNAKEVKKHDFEELPDLPRQPPDVDKGRPAPPTNSVPPERWKE